ncbi:hypothetical protein Sjap_025250 [Stephania japonica]|uniref:Uncharacterized protein n=1 Tax=Stephania japonica TaxID=461633 RepID=A0AAP0HFE7_9MAGN
MKIHTISQSSEASPSSISSSNRPPKTRRRRVRCEGVSGARRRGGAAATPMPLSRRKGGDAATAEVSARRLGAELWLMQGPIVGGGDERGRRSFGSDRSGFEIGDRLSFCKGTNEDLLKSPHSVASPKNGVPYKVERSFSYADSAMERATKWDHGDSKASEEFNSKFCSQKKVLRSHRASTAVSVVSTLQAELEEAQNHIEELEAERLSSKKEFERFMRKLAEEKASWRMREHEKVRAIIDDIKHDLNREKKNRKRMEIVNSKLINELAEVKLSAKQFMQDYEKERKSRELLEEVCDELAKEIGEEKSEVEAMKRGSMKIHEEIEEERKMLQLAEVWREERVQMKLVDAKLILENKYSQLNKLMADMEAFLKSRGVTTDTKQIREAELLQQAANSVTIQEIKEFHYEPPKSDEIFSVVEELQPVGPNDVDNESCLDYSPSCGSKVHCASPKAPNPFGRNGFVSYKHEEEEGSGWETVSNVEDQDSSFSPQGSDLSVNRTGRVYISESGTEWEGKTNQDTPKTEISEVSSRSKKGSSISRLWRSNPLSNSRNYKTVAAEASSNGIFSNCRIVSLGQESCEGVGSPQSFNGRWSSCDKTNPYVSNGTKADSKLSQAVVNGSLKAKLLEARIENQKVQLRQVLKQKI